MSLRGARRLIRWGVLWAVLLVAGCALPFGDSETLLERVELGEVNAARVLVQMTAGELTIDGGAAELLEGEFTFAADRWAPEIDYVIMDDTGDLAVRQPTTSLPGMSLQSTENIWNLHLTDAVPVNLVVQVGVGESRLNLTSLRLAALDLEAGAGQSVIDLSGDWRDDIGVHIVGGAGRLTLRLPADIGVRVNVVGGAGEVNVTGLRLQDDESGAWINAAYNDTGPTLILDIQGGAGQIDLEVVE